MSWWVAVACVSFMSVMLMMTLTLRARAASEDLIAFDDDSSCSVAMHDLHSSTRPAGDVSVEVSVSCFVANSSAPMIVDEMRVETTISFSPLGIPLGAEELGTCPPVVRNNRSSDGFPCHQATRGDGLYIATATVRVTVAGTVEEIEISDDRYFDPGAIA